MHVSDTLCSAYHRYAITSRKALYHHFLFFLFLKGRKVPSPTSLPGGKEKIMVWTKRRSRKFCLTRKQTIEKLS